MVYLIWLNEKWKKSGHRCPWLAHSFGNWKITLLLKTSRIPLKTISLDRFDQILNIFLTTNEQAFVFLSKPVLCPLSIIGLCVCNEIFFVKVCFVSQFNCIYNWIFALKVSKFGMWKWGRGLFESKCLRKRPQPLFGQPPKDRFVYFGTVFGQVRREPE